MVNVESVRGEAAVPHIPALARLRITVFREFPYLYDGSAEYEERYLATYAEAPDSVIVLARDGEAVVGAATALPLRQATEDVRTPFRAAGFDLGRIFYFGESVLLPTYRGRGIGVAFFDHREAHARSFGCYEKATFCAVIRPPDHPRRPKDHVPLDGFWRRRGYRPAPGIEAGFDWKDLDEAAENPKRMAFWIKDLAA